MAPLNRRAVHFLTAAFALLAVSTGVLYRATSAPYRVPPLSQHSDSTGFHPSDVALIGTNGTPQLLEFFHPE